MRCNSFLLNALIFIFSSVFLGSMKAQTVSAFASTPSNADVAVDKDEYVYVTSESSSVIRISPSGEVETSPFASGANFVRASGLSFDNSGTTLYVTNRPLGQFGWITKVNPDGSNEIFASGLNFPGDITFDESGNMFVTEFSNNVRKISPDGTMSLYASSPIFNTALGIAWTPGDTLFVSSAHDGNIYKLSPGNPVQIEWFARVDGLQQAWACGFMTYSFGNLYITNGDNKVHKIDMNGTVTDFAGTGALGGTDGPVEEAEFTAPNGIGFNQSSSKMYVSEYGINRIRKIDDLISSVGKTIERPSFFNVYPNPFRDELTFEFDLKKQSTLSVQIYDMKGTLVKEFNQDFKSGGKHRIRWEVEKDLHLNGIYNCVIKSGNKIQNIKLTRQ